jgi:hypothetical protein
LKHHSKRATRVAVVNGFAVVIQNRFAGDKAIINRVRTSVVAREHIVVETQPICKEKRNQENDIHEGTLNEDKMIMARDG